MRKKTIKNLCDSVFWYIIYLLPLLMALLPMFGMFGGTDLTNYTPYDVFSNYLDTALNTFGVGDSAIWYALYDLFGANGVLPLFLSGTAISYMTYFVSMVLVHLAVDFLLFIPRIAHKFLNAFTRED